MYEDIDAILVRDDRVRCLKLQQIASNVTWSLAKVGYVASGLQAAFAVGISHDWCNCSLKSSEQAGIDVWWHGGRKIPRAS